MAPSKCQDVLRKVTHKRSAAFQAIQRNLRKTPVPFASYQNNEVVKKMEVSRLALSTDVFKTIF